MGETKRRQPTVPKGLSPAGRALWSTVVKTWDLRPDELAILAEACRTKDELARLEDAMKSADVLTKGSAGQTVVHPLYEAVRQHRRVLAEQLRGIGLPDDPADDQGTLFPGAGQTSSAARDLAHRRWRAG